MSTKRVKAAIGWEMNAVSLAKIVQPDKGRYFAKKKVADHTEARFILPADAASYERMVFQMAKSVRILNAKNWFSSRENDARASLRAIGIVPPKQPKKGTK